MLESFLSLGSQGRVEIEVNRSRFIAQASPVADETAFHRFLDNIRHRFPDATHHVYAYRVGLDVETQRFSDAGEPGGTAGLPILEILQREDLRNAAVVVSRYFGGRKLGASGLVRAYSNAGSEAVRAAGIVRMLLHRRVKIACDYPDYGRLKNFLQGRGLPIIETAFGTSVDLTTDLPSACQHELVNRILNLTGAKTTITELEPLYRPAPETGQR